MHCPTVKIQHEKSYITINESDFDKGKHKLYVEPKAVTAKKAKS